MRSRGPRSRRERGSTILYAVVLCGVAATLVVANLQASSTLRSMQVRREAVQRMEYAKIAAAAQINDTIRNNPTDDLSDFDMTVGGESFKVTAATTGSPREIALSLSGARSGSGTVTTYDPRGKHPFLYGLYEDGAANLKAKLTLGSAAQNTHAYFSGTVSQDKNASVNVTGVAETKGGTDPGFDSATMLSTGVARPSLASSSTVYYTLVADQSYLTSRTIGSGTYKGSGDNYVISSTAKITVTGTIRGRVTIYTTGNITIQPPLVMADANSKLVLICKNDVDIPSGGRVEAFLYTEGKLRIPKPANSVTWVGAIACEGFDMDADLNLTLDPYFYDRDQIAAFRLPISNYGLD